MREHLERRFADALAIVSLADLTRETERSRSAWEKYRLGLRRPTAAAARELAAYLRGRSDQLARAADALEHAVAEQEGANDGK